MAFYNNRVCIADVNGKEIYLIKNTKNELILNYYSYKGEIVESVLANDLLEEFDILINDDDSIYIIYQDLKYYLNLLIIKGRDVSSHKLTTERFSKIFELNILRHNNATSMFFLYPINNSQKIFQIEHYMLKDNEWFNFKVDEARVNQILNPIKVINNGGKIFLAYYYENQICLKTFDSIKGEWKESLVLTDNKEKLYLDLLYVDEYFHVVYSEAVDDNYIIRYKNFKYPGFVEEESSSISRKSNSSNPTIILKDNKLWIIWNESSRIYSKNSSDKGKTWSEIVNFDEYSKNNIVRYKYITNNNVEDTIIHNTFGTIYPDIKFIGFN
ncbi:MAG: hypothetical protein RIN55_12355 [Tissierellaceae bacterium]|nr:hypothetical protein [Tissierellaceae bacterium]